MAYLVLSSVWSAAVVTRGGPAPRGDADGRQARGRNAARRSARVGSRGPSRSQRGWGLDRNGHVVPTPDVPDPPRRGGPPTARNGRHPGPERPRRPPTDPF